MISRKTITAVIGIVSAVLAFFSEQFGLSIDPVAVMAGLASIVTYVLLEGKLDIKRVGSQIGKFKDLKFWLAFISAILVAVNEALGLKLPVEAIVAVLTVIMGFLFKAEFKKATTTTK